MKQLRCTSQRWICAVLLSSANGIAELSSSQTKLNRPPHAHAHRLPALPGRRVGKDLVQEFLIGETKTNTVAKTIINEDVVDKNIKPAAGEKWKVVESIWQTPEGEVGAISLNECVAGWNRISHACVYVYSDADRKVQLWAGVVSDDVIKLIVNGKVVHTRH